jgi:hypothetical protein
MYDFIRIFKNLHVTEQPQHKILLQKYEPSIPFSNVRLEYINMEYETN